MLYCAHEPFDTETKYTTGETTEDSSSRNGSQDPDSDSATSGTDDVGLDNEDDDFRRRAMNEVMNQDELEGLRMCDLQNGSSQNSPQAEAGPSRHGAQPPPPDSTALPGMKKRMGVFDGMVQAEITKRKRESLGMDGPGKKLGVRKKGSAGVSTIGPVAETKGDSKASPLVIDDQDDNASFWAGDLEVSTRQVDGSWACGVCTL